MTHQEEYYRELRLERLIQKYLHAMHTVKDFEHSSIGIAMAKQMYDLSPPKL